MAIANFVMARGNPSGKGIERIALWPRRSGMTRRETRNVGGKKMNLKTQRPKVYLLVILGSFPLVFTYTQSCYVLEDSLYLSSEGPLVSLNLRRDTILCCIVLFQ